MKLHRINTGIYEGDHNGHAIRIERIEDAKSTEPQWNLFVDGEWHQDHWTKAQAQDDVIRMFGTLEHIFSNY